MDIPASCRANCAAVNHTPGQHIYLPGCPAETSACSAEMFSHGYGWNRVSTSQPTSDAIQKQAIIGSGGRMGYYGDARATLQHQHLLPACSPVLLVVQQDLCAHTSTGLRLESASRKIIMTTACQRSAGWPMHAVQVAAVGQV